MQRDLPGTAPITQAQLAQRRACAPLKSAKPQRPCDEGLFSDERDQLDLVDMLRQSK